MTTGSYQRRYLRAPLKERLLFADGSNVLLARALNISEDGMLVDELPNFPDADEVPLMLSVPVLPMLKNASLLQLQTFTQDMIERKIIRAKARIVRKMELSQNLDNIFKSKFGLQFVRLLPDDRKNIEQYVASFSSNLVHLQTLIDTYNSDEMTRSRSKALAAVLGYREEKIAQLRMMVEQDYQSLQWI